MSTPITTLGFVPGQNLNDQQFDPEELAAAELLLRQYLVDAFPTLNAFQNSTIYDLVIRPRAVTYMLSRAEWSALRATSSLKGILENPDLAEQAVVDAVLSNNLLVRRMGSRATGRIRVILQKSGTYSISNDVVASTATGQSFAPKESYRVTLVPSEENDIQLQSLADGSFYFLLPVIANTNGLDHQLHDGQQVTFSIPIDGLVVAAAYGNFQGGSDDETNEELIARIPEAQSVKNLSIRAALRETFPDIMDVSVQGMNGPAMTRNSHNALGLKTGGYSDIYVRTGQTVSVGTVSKTATLIDIDEDDNATYRVILGRDDFPGHYVVRSVLPDLVKIVGSWLILSENKSFENRVDGVDQAIGTERPNKIVDVQEACYSRYQTNEILFRVDFDESLGTLPADQFASSMKVSVEVAWMPLIKEIQQFVNDRDRGIMMADQLVKAAVPCFIQLSVLQIEADSGTSTTDIRQAVYSYINGIPMGQKLRADEIVSAIKSVKGVRFVQLPIKITGDIYAPTGAVMEVRGDSSLTIPNRPDLQVVPDNTAFIIEMSDIPMSLITL